MLAAFTGYEVIGRVPTILHTPLMSGSNFVHGIVLVGAMVALGRATTTLELVIGFLGVALAAGNAVGGYVVTERMLEMFKSSKPAGGQQTGPERREDSTDGRRDLATALVSVSYLLAAFLFITGLKRMSSPVTARGGIVWAGAGMVVATDRHLLHARPRQFRADAGRYRAGRRRGLVHGQARRHDRHAPDDRALQRHGRRRGGGHRRRGAVQG